MIKYETIQQEYHICDECGQILDVGYNDNIVITQGEEKEFCNTCFKELAIYCELCDEYHLSDDLFEIEIYGKDISVCYLKYEEVILDLENAIRQLAFNFD